MYIYVCIYLLHTLRSGKRDYHHLSKMLLRWEELEPSFRAARAGSPGRCGQPSSSVRPSPGRESHKGPIYIRVRSFAILFSLSSSPRPPPSRVAARSLTLDT